MKRHYTTTDLCVLRALSKPGWADVFNLEIVPTGRTDIFWQTILNSLGRLVTDNLIALRYVNDDIQARRLSWPIELSRILAA